MDIGNTGIWSENLANQIHHRSQSAKVLPEFMAAFFDKDKPVFDFGCGNGYYLGELEKKGFECYGIEGTKMPSYLCKTVFNRDISKVIDIRKDGYKLSGNVISLELIEHIPAKYEQIVLDNITRHCANRLILSWALTGQPGEGHVNTVEQSYAIKQLFLRGFELLPHETKKVRSEIENNCNWFRNTLLIFERV